MLKHHTGLVIGKFYPFHKGHIALIEHALNICDKVLVIVAGSAVESIPVHVRKKWVEETFNTPRVVVIGEYDETEVNYKDEHIWQKHVDVFNNAIIRAHIDRGIPRPNVLISSETYGRKLAEMLQITNHVFDIDRTAHKISGTAIRKNVTKNYPLMSEAAQKDLCQKIVVVGTDSSGTTTLSTDLHKHLLTQPHFNRTRWVPEWGRYYTEIKLKEYQKMFPDATVEDLQWLAEEFFAIGKTQVELENKQRGHTGPVLVCDTDAWTTTLWARRYGTQNSAVQKGLVELANKWKPSLYILTDHHDVDFENDGLRDCDGLREEMTSWFEQELPKTNVQWIKVTGSRKQRLETSVRTTLDVINTRLKLSDPR